MQTLRSAFLLLLGFLLLPCALHAQPAAKTQVSLLADHATVTPGQTLLLGLRLVSPPHWHTYWKNPGDAGSVTQVEWKDTANATLGNWQWPAPILFRQGIVNNFVYEGDTVILIPLTVSAQTKPGDTVSLKGTASWLECDDRSCVPQEAEVSLTLSVGASATPVNTALFTQARAALPVATDAWKITASRDGTTLVVRLQPNGPDANTGVKDILFFPDDDQVPPAAVPKISTEGDTRVFVFDVKDAYKKDGTALGGVFTAPASWLKSNPAAKAIQFTARYDGTAVPATPTATAAQSAAETKNDPAALTWEPWTPEKQQELLDAGKTIYIDFTARWCATCQVNKHVYNDSDVIAAFLKNDIVLLKADWTKKNPAIAAELAKYNRAAIPFNIFLSKDRPPVILSELLTAGHVLGKLDVALGRQADDPAAVASEKQDPAFPLQLAFAFLGGLILNLMPCVFPVIGLKIMNFVSQAGENSRKIVAHGLVFTAGVVLSFWILAGLLIWLRLRGEVLGWGFQLQEPGFVLVMIVLLLVFALNMAGVFEIGGRLVGVGSNLTGKSGLQGSFFSGVLATVIATPCAAPFLAPALGAALALPPVQSYLMFTLIALGLAAPYLFLSAFPQFIRLLPRPGPWMESFKQGLSFLLFGTVLYLLWVLIGQIETVSLQIFLGLTVIAFACWVYGRWAAPHRTQKVRLIGTGVAAVLLLGTCAWYYTILQGV